MEIERLPGLKKFDDLQRIRQSIVDGIYWSRRSGRIISSDLFEETLNVIDDIRFKN